MHLPSCTRAVTRAAVPIAVVTALVLSGTGAAVAATTNPSPNDLELAKAQLSKRATTEGMVLLENNDAALDAVRRAEARIRAVEKAN